MAQNSKQFSVTKIVLMTCLLLIVGFLTYTGIVLEVQGHNLQKTMQSSKNSKEVYNMSKESRDEAAVRDSFDQLYNRYFDSKSGSLKDPTKVPSTTELTSLSKMVNKVGSYYQADYKNRYSLISTITDVQKDYLALFTKGQVGHVFKLNIRPNDIYHFNEDHYADLQTISALDANSTYPAWMLAQMQAMGQDAGLVETFLKEFSQTFTFPTDTKSWQVGHGYMDSDQQRLTQELQNIKYVWHFLDFAKQIVAVSDSTAHYNRDMQNKVDDANRQIQAVKDAVKAKQDEAKKQKQAQDDAKKAAEQQKAQDAQKAADDAKKAAEQQSSSSSSSSASSSSSSSSN